MNKLKHALVSVFALTLGLSLLPLSQSFAQAGYGLAVEYSTNISEPVLGDRITVTARITKAGELFTEDLPVTLSIKNKKVGQSCQLLDGTTKGDGIIKFTCDSVEEAGGIEVELEEDDDYYSLNYTFKTDYYDPNQFCSPLPQPPVISSITPQNDITADVSWTQSEPFVGSFTIAYGTSPDSLSTRSTHTNKSHTASVISGLNPQQTYYVQVESNTCGTQLKSKMYTYQPASGAFAVYTGSATKPSPTPTTNTTTENVTRPSSSLTASASPEPTATASTSASPVPEESASTDQLLEESDSDDTEATNPALYILGAVVLLGAVGGGAWYWKTRKQQSLLQDEQSEATSEISSELNSSSEVTEKNVDAEVPSQSTTTKKS